MLIILVFLSQFHPTAAWSNEAGTCTMPSTTNHVNFGSSEWQASNGGLFPQYLLHPMHFESRYELIVTPSSRAYSHGSSLTVTLIGAPMVGVLLRAYDSNGTNPLASVVLSRMLGADYGTFSELPAGVQYNYVRFDLGRGRGSCIECVGLLPQPSGICHAHGR